LPTVTVNSPSICPGTPAALTAAGATTYTWSAGATSTGVNTATASPVATTTYTVTGTSLGCSNTAVSTVTMGASISITATGDTICSGSVASLTASGATTYTWSAGATSTGTNTATASPASTTTYTVTGTSAGCSGTATATVAVTAMPVASFTAPFTTPEINPTVPFTNTSINATSYLWNFGDLLNTSTNTSTETNPSHTYTQAGLYCAKLVASNGTCVDSTLRCVEITAEFTFYIPNTFTPNRDGSNEEFYGKGTNIKSCETSIYNRWGELLFNTTDMNLHWTGKNTNGEFLQSDVYVYTMTVIDYLGNEHKYIGNITLLN
jgi:hypothetical protein